MKTGQLLILLVDTIDHQIANCLRSKLILSIVMFIGKPVQIKQKKKEFHE